MPSPKQLKKIASIIRRWGRRHDVFACDHWWALTRWRSRHALEERRRVRRRLARWYDPKQDVE